MIWPLIPTILLLLLVAVLYEDEGAIHTGQAPRDPIKVEKVYLYIDQMDLNYLYERDDYSDEEIPGVVKYDPEGEEVALRGLRFRGNSSRQEPKKSFRITFEESQEVIFGSRRMNLNAMYTDPSMMREGLSMDLFSRLGHPAPRTQYVELYINDVYEGLYMHVERIDEDFLTAMGLSDKGTLVRDGFRGEVQRADMEDLSFFGFDLEGIDDPEAFVRDNFDYRGNPDWEALLELGKWVEETQPGAEYARGFMERIDIESFVDWLAVHLLVGDIDAFYDDYWLYLDHRVADAKWQWIPWDKDLTFGSVWRPVYNVSNDYFYYQFQMRMPWVKNDLIVKFMETPQLMALVYERTEVLLDEVFTLEKLSIEIDRIAEKIRPSVEVSPGVGAFRLNPRNHFGQLGNFEDHVEAIKDYVALRGQYLRKYIGHKGRLPAEGRFESTVRWNEQQLDQPLYFVDEGGWVIGKWQGKALAEEGKLSIEVKEVPSVVGINRIWTLVYEGAPIQGELTLYYLNDTENRNNWYETYEAVGGQRELQMIESNGIRWRELPSRVNPYSNKVVATMELSGVHQLSLTKGSQQ
ncbi:Spore coat protein CotH [Alkaliphilus metalliredigens QYMF]|uniref:Spore coat protein CotH n=2 Tax=Alkaliphilus TaxID=114627 RepID=A6TK23_ALKMQ|nr:Spore coat protein CotH [Alkaliphilus metalliredigens QYMF]